MLELKVSGGHVSVRAEVLRGNPHPVDDVIFIYDLQAEGIQNGSCQVGSQDGGRRRGDQSDLLPQIEIEIKEFSAMPRPHPVFDIPVRHGCFKRMFSVDLRKIRKWVLFRDLFRLSSTH